jgi:proteasome lid subunit RPN8/RPN11
MEEEGEPHITRAERIPNSRPQERGRRFLITPEEYRRVETLAAAEGLLLLGFYHSHPDHPAVPSEYDREHALPFFHYLVLAVASGGPGDLTAWKLSEEREVFQREELVIQTFQG